MEPWAYVPAEAVVSLLLALWMARGFAGGDEKELLDRSAARRLGVLALPAALLIGLIALQIVPLPPGLVRVISPTTFELYQRSLPGWPKDSLAYQTGPANGRTPHSMVALPTADEVAAGVSIPFSAAAPPDYQSNESRASARGQATPAIGVWRTLSISPALTEPALLKLIAYAGLFLLVTTYPLREDAERRFGRRLAQVVLVAGLITAAVALIERVYSNGRALWLFLPYDWRSGNPWGERAVGSFANPDHLANYLAQTLPFAVAAVFWPAALSRRRPEALRALAAAAVILISGALLLSSSRGGWLGALMSLTVLGTLWPHGTGGAQRRAAGKIAVATSLGLFLIVLLMFVGPGGRTQADARLKETVANESLMGREAPALATLAMLRDFPLFGVGLGCWPEVFPHYVRPPWTPTFWNATHNDYVQIAAETGALGFVLLAWFLIGVGWRIHEGIGAMRPEAQLLVAAALAAASATAVHEFFDFPLQVPANALLLTALLGLAVRLTGDQSAALSPGRRRLHPRFLYAMGLLAAVGWLLATVAQKRTPYPYDLHRPASIAQAYALIDAYPANAKAHLALAGMLAGTARPADRFDELHAAVWLDPTNPYSRDLYAQAMLGQNETAVAFSEIARSVSNAPDLAMHFYLRPRIVPWLPEPERNAISTGFKFAIARRYQGAVENFASYDDELGDVKAEAALYEAAAEAARGDGRRAAYLSNAGTAYLNANEPRQAETALRTAIAVAPADSESYVRLIDGVFGPSRNWPAANALIAQGIGQGADPVMLYRALAQAAQTAGDYAIARDALQQALAARPADFAAIMQMGQLDLADNHPDRAAIWFRSAAQLRPDSSEAFSYLGRAEDSAYEYFAADQAYRRALAIAPGDGGLRQQYAAFRQRVAENSTSRH
ncbi:MAG: O-antigen ligase family protein [Candidatus Binataceae bacterium]|nr:O-antigen ligase family protein [Candidatus Binataceae bacterium]